jgi:hypothetical protein
MRRDLTRPRTWAAGIGRASRKVMGLEDIEKMSGELAMADGYRGKPLIVDLPVDRCRLLRPSTAYAFFGAQTAF